MHYQTGNILFLILIAVALFAALSYAVTSSSRSSSSGVSAEQTKIGVNRMLQHASAIEQAITKMRVINGCTESQISAYSELWETPSDYNNTSAPADGRCNIYHPNGGGIAWQKPPESVTSPLNGMISGNPMTVEDYWYDVRRHVRDIGVQAPHNSGFGNDVLLRVQVTEEACRYINKKFRGTETIPTNSWAYYNLWDDFDTSPQTTLQNEMRGQRTMCFLQTGGSNNVHQFYHIVMAR